MNGCTSGHLCLDMSRYISHNDGSLQIGQPSDYDETTTQQSQLLSYYFEHVNFVSSRVFLASNSDTNVLFLDTGIKPPPLDFTLANTTGRNIRSLSY